MRRDEEFFVGEFFGNKQQSHIKEHVMRKFGFEYSDKTVYIDLAENPEEVQQLRDLKGQCESIVAMGVKRTGLWIVGELSCGNQYALMTNTGSAKLKLTNGHMRKVLDGLAEQGFTFTHEEGVLEYEI